MNIFVFLLEFSLFCYLHGCTISLREKSKVETVHPIFGCLEWAESRIEISVDIKVLQYQNVRWSDKTWKKFVLWKLYVDYVDLLYTLRIITFSSNLMNRVLGPPIDALLYENATKSGISNTRIPFNFDKGAIWLKFLWFCSLSWRSTSALHDHNGRMSSTSTGSQDRDFMISSLRCLFKTRTLSNYISFLATYYE